MILIVELQFKVKEIAKRKGIDTAYKLKEKAGLAPSTAYRLFNNTVTTITLDTLKRVCHALECDPGDVFVWTNKQVSAKKGARQGNNRNKVKQK